jgi:signal transduction histidine kinase
MNFYNLAILCFGFCSFLLGLFVWLKRGDEIGKRYFWMALFYSAWAIFIAINLNNDISYGLGLFFGRLGNGFAAFIPVTWYHFAVTYAGSFQTKRRFLKILYALSALIACFSFSPWFIPEVKSMVGFKYYSQAGPLYYFFAVMFFIVVPLSFFELYKKMKISNGAERLQLKGLLITSLIGYVGGSPTFFPIFGIPFPQYTLALLPFYPFLLAYFMIKQKLFDVSVLADAIQTAKLTALGVIAASINHEIRNPLYVIKGLAETLAEKAADPLASKEQVLARVKEITDKTVAQSDRVLGIIKSFSSYAKRETDKVYEKQSMRVKTVVERILPFVESELSLKNIKILQDIPEGLEIFVDVQSLEEIFINLIVNACQAMPGGGEIRIKAEIATGANRPRNDVLARSLAEGGTTRKSVIITISDTGPGIPKELLSRIFEPFYTTKASGTGLGLYVVKQLVEKNGGKVEVSSQAGRGTMFNLSLSL